MIVETKAQNYRLYEAGYYGNKLRTWSSLEEIYRSGYSGRIVMRYKGRFGGAQYPRLGEHLTLHEARAVHHAWRALGAQREAIAYNEAAPDHALVLQGEVMLSIEHISLFWSDAKTQMRRAMVNGRQANGLLAIGLLRHYLFPSSFADLEELFTQFPDSVIEFSAYRYAVGSIPGRNAVIWEVRNY